MRDELLWDYPLPTAIQPAIDRPAIKIPAYQTPNYKTPAFKTPPLPHLSALGLYVGNEIISDPFSISRYQRLPFIFTFTLFEPSFISRRTSSISHLASLLYFHLFIDTILHIFSGLPHV